VVDRERGPENTGDAGGLTLGLLRAGRLSSANTTR